MRFKTKQNIFKELIKPNNNFKVLSFEKLTQKTYSRLINDSDEISIVVEGIPIKKKTETIYIVNYDIRALLFKKDSEKGMIVIFKGKDINRFWKIIISNSCPDKLWKFNTELINSQSEGIKFGIENQKLKIDSYTELSKNIIKYFLLPFGYRNNKQWNALLNDYKKIVHSDNQNQIISVESKIKFLGFGNYLEYYKTLNKIN